MKKSELIEYGIPMEKTGEFQRVYWQDVRKQAARMVEEAKGQEAAPSTAAMREAIASMVRLIPDPERLGMILNNVNRHYSTYMQEERERKVQDERERQKQQRAERATATPAHPAPVEVSPVEADPVKVQTVEGSPSIEGGLAECP